VFIAPIEVLAAITYVNSVQWVHDNFNMLNDAGLLNGHGWSSRFVLMVLFTSINLAGAKFLSESNIVVVVWKTVVPFLAVAVVAGMQFNPDNFHAGGGFMPFGFHGVFAALTGGVVFRAPGLRTGGPARRRGPQSEEGPVARDPDRDGDRRAALHAAPGRDDRRPRAGELLNGWKKPLGTDPSKLGAWYTLALAVGAGWLAKVLLIDAIISPAGTGVVYVGTSARLSYALGEEREMPSALSQTNKRGVPVVSILVTAVIGCVAFGPFKSWNALVGVVTAATAIMYAFAPISLAALHKLDPDRQRSYRMPAPTILLPAAFCSANLIIYWGGFDTTWEARGRHGGRPDPVRDRGRTIRQRRGEVRPNAGWMGPWFAGHVILGALGRYGGGYEVLPPWVDIAVVIAFALGIFYFALG